MRYVHRAVLAALAAAVCSLTLVGCSNIRGATKVEDVKPPRLDATRTQLLELMKMNMLNLTSVTAKAMVVAVNQNVVVAATIPDDMRRLQGKPYSKKFDRGEVNGSLIMQRAKDGGRNLRFSGEVVPINASFMLLGRENAFWIVMPNIGQSDGKERARGTIYVGADDKHRTRGKDFFSMRPQDLWDLYLTDEVLTALHGTGLCFMETWPDFYILNFLDPNWPSLITSKIWVEREGLNMVMHQIYDASGEVVAEARLGDIKTFSAKGDAKHPVRLATKLMVLWPRDNAVLEMELSNIQVNNNIDAKYFVPVKPEGYVEQPVLLPGQLSPGSPVAPVPSPGVSAPTTTVPAR